ncbi:IclR family transcriptional regulator [Micrococcaceae bacterium Sec6.3]
MPPETSRSRPVRAEAPSQTLSRALTMLEAVAEAPTPPTIAELAEGLGVHRSVAYRMLRTFEEHGLLRRDDAGRVLVAPGLAVLAGRVEPDLRAAALPELTSVSADLHMTAFLVVWDGADCLTLATVEPPRGNLVTQRPGTRHPLGVGAPGIALAAAMPEAEWAAQRARRAEGGQGVGPHDDGAERPEVAGARARGWASSRDEVITGVSSVAVPLAVRGQFPAALAVVFATRAEDLEAIGARLSAAAQRVAAVLGDG